MDCGYYVSIFAYGKTNISTKETATIKGTWIPDSNEEFNRKDCPSTSTGEGSQEAYRLGMLPQAYRLRLEKDIKTLFARGKSVFGSLVGMKFRANALPVSRFAIVAGVKVSKKAVVRNRLKRQVRAIIHELLSKIAPGYDVLLYLKHQAVDKSSEELKKEVFAGFKKAKLL